MGKGRNGGIKSDRFFRRQMRAQESRGTSKKVENALARRLRKQEGNGSTTIIQEGKVENIEIGSAGQVIFGGKEREV